MAIEQLNTAGSFVLVNEGIESGYHYKTENLKVAVYEVIRFINGVPLFFDEHMNRLINSVSLVECFLNINEGDLCGKLTELSKINKIEFGNLMLKVLFFEDSYDVLAYFIPHKYPEKEDYDCGVEVDLLRAERTNPEAKVENVTVRSLANRQIEETGVYEVLLVNQNEEITEGSRSNFFGVKGGCLYTAPFSSVLQGITMLKTLRLADLMSVPVCFESIKANELENFDALFLTGTSPKILPVSRIGGLQFNVDNLVMRKLMQSYQQLISEDIAKRRDSL